MTMTRGWTAVLMLQSWHHLILSTCSCRQFALLAIQLTCHRNAHDDHNDDAAAADDDVDDDDDDDDLKRVLTAELLDQLSLLN